MSNKRKRNTTESSNLAKKVGNPTNDSTRLSECEILFINKSKDSFVWTFFGDLVLKENGVKTELFSEKYVCNRCFQIELERSKEPKLLKDCNIKSYSTSVSTGNLANHLRSHGITQHKPLQHSLRTLDNFFNTNRPVYTTSCTTNKKFTLIRDLVLLCCKDLFPFNLVSGEGLIDFFMKYNIVVSPEDIPHRTSIGRALSDVYEDCKAYVIKRIKTDCPDFASLTFDMWSDKHRRRSYITFTLHFVDKEFRLINLTLATIHFPERHTGVNIQAELEKIVVEFELDNKHLYMVTDAGTNCRLACELGNFAALLDPRQQNLLDIKEYLKHNNISAVDLLIKWLKKTGAIEENIGSTVELVQTEMQAHSYVEELLEKHSSLSSLSETMSTSSHSRCQRECYFLLSMGGKIEINNILDFWKNQAISMPRLSKLASKLLSIPVTSTPSERNFSIAGIIIDSKRSRLSPDHLDFILFVHNNYDFIKEVTFRENINYD